MPEASLSYDWSEHLMSYLRISRGYREGGFNSGEAGPEAAYDPEKAWSYECGVKSAWFNERLIMNFY